MINVVIFSLSECMRSLLNVALMFNRVKYLLSCIRARVSFINDKEKRFRLIKALSFL